MGYVAYSSVPNKRPGTPIRHASMKNSFSALSGENSFSAFSGENSFSALNGLYVHCPPSTLIPPSTFIRYTI